MKFLLLDDGGAGQLQKPTWTVPYVRRQRVPHFVAHADGWQLHEMSENLICIVKRDVTLADITIHQRHMIAREGKHLCAIFDVEIIKWGSTQRLL